MKLSFLVVFLFIVTFYQFNNLVSSLNSDINEETMNLISDSSSTPTTMKKKFLEYMRKSSSSSKKSKDTTDIRKELEAYITSKIQGKDTCVICTLIVTTSVQYSNMHNIAIDKFLYEEYCQMFSDMLALTCQTVIEIYGPDIISDLKSGKTPDQVCNNLNICTMPQCSLSSQFTLNNRENILETDREMSRFTRNQFISSGKFNPFQWLEDLLDRAFKDHEPMSDYDKDSFSSFDATFRGYNWRGKDCDDDNDDIYPGRKTNSHYAGIDYNCNGIVGTDNNGNSFKDLFCANSQQMGVGVIGDSAGAHFQIPPKWVNASMFTKTTYHDLIKLVENELDLPHMSAYTGYVKSTPENLVNSVYLYMADRNKCNFKDYQNCGVNGGDSFNTINNMKRLKRDQNNDHPMILFLELIGNDVCGSSPDVSSMTSPVDFKNNMLTILNQLNETLPQGSHVWIYGLAQGTVLYNTLHNYTHPIGVPVTVFYDYLNCLEISPCAGWMNTNETIRNNTQNHADLLNNVSKSIVQDYKFVNFDVVYYDVPVAQMINEWIAAGNSPNELIEPVDMFHPSQQGNAVMANITWNNLLKDHPDWLGDVNPNNNLIEEFFGNQGGYE